MQLHNLLKFPAAWAVPAGPAAPIVLSARVRLARNLTGRPFPGVAGPQALKEIRAQAFATLKATQVLRNAAFLDLEDLEPVDRRLLVERRLISRDLAERPEGRGLAVEDGERLSAMVNEEDHLRLQAMGPGSRLDPVFAALDGLDDALAARLPFAFHERWGFLAACPTNTGTGLRASVLVHLAAVAALGKVGALLEEAARRGLVVRGLYGEGTRVAGDLFQVSTGTAMGKTEAAFVSELARAVRALVELEVRAERVLTGPAQRARLEDRAFRAVGLLAGARRLGFEDMMAHLSLARLGLRCGLKLAARPAVFDELMVTGQPAHLRYALKREFPAEEEPEARAALVRVMLKGRRLKAEG